jgi:hypothetical protein
MASGVVCAKRGFSLVDWCSGAGRVKKEIEEMKNIFALIAMAGLAGAAHAQWDETVNGGGDAGDLASTAQVVSGSGPLTSITGLFDTNDADLYVVRVVDPANFLATTVGGTSLDTQIWLFDMSGMGIAFNDDAVGLQSRLQGSDVFTTGAFTGSTIASMLVAGQNYIVGVTRYNRDPVDSASAAIFANSPFAGIHSRTATAGPLAGWVGNTAASSSVYTISLGGVEFVPAPGAAALLGLSGLLIARRRR